MDWTGAADNAEAEGFLRPEKLVADGIEKARPEKGGNRPFKGFPVHPGVYEFPEIVKDIARLAFLQPLDLNAGTRTGEWLISVARGA